MAIFAWNDQYRVNVQEIDKQHKKLVETLNTLHAAMLSGKSREILADIIKNLVEYTGYHFSFEEQNMIKYHYPAYLQHKKEHDHFTEKVIDFQKKQKEGRVMVSLEVMNFLKDWLQNHILGTDKKYSSFFNEKGPGQEDGDIVSETGGHGDEAVPEGMGEYGPFKGQPLGQGRPDIIGRQMVHEGVFH